MLNTYYKIALKNILSLVFILSVTQAMGQVCTACAGSSGPFGEYWANCGDVNCDLDCPGCPEPDTPVDQGVLFILGAGLAIIGFTYYKKAHIKTA